MELLGLKSFTPVTTDTFITTITYAPTPALTIRDILNFEPPIHASIYTPPSMMDRTREMLKNETRKLEKLFLSSAILAGPTFVFGMLVMNILPDGNRWKVWCEAPVWGGATRSVIALWALATLVQGYVNR